jgi:hypothetical protein
MKILKELPTLCIQYLTQLFSAILLRGYFPSQWKVAQIILIPKPGKPHHQVSAARTLAVPTAGNISTVLTFILSSLLRNPLVMI